MYSLKLFYERKVNSFGFVISFFIAGSFTRENNLWLYILTKAFAWLNTTRAWENIQIVTVSDLNDFLMYCSSVGNLNKTTWG